MCVHALLEQYGYLSGIVHPPGIIKDNFIVRKAPEELLSVLAPKVAGALNLDRQRKDWNWISSFSFRRWRARSQCRAKRLRNGKCILGVVRRVPYGVGKATTAARAHSIDLLAAVAKRRNAGGCGTLAHIRRLGFEPMTAADGRKRCIDAGIA